MALSNQFTVFVLYLPHITASPYMKKLFLQVIHHLFLGQRIYKLSKKSQQQNKLRNVPIVNEIPPWFRKSPNVEFNIMRNLTKKAMSMTSMCKISYRYNQCKKIYTDGSPSLINKMEEEHVYMTRKRFFIILCIYCSSSTYYSLDTELLEIDASLCFVWN